MVDSIRKPFGILLQGLTANRFVTIRNLTKKENYPETIIANTEGNAGISCANFATEYSEGDIIRFSGNGVNDFQEDITITKSTTGSIKKRVSISTIYSGGL